MKPIDRFSVKGRVAVVTGGASGLGFAMARALAMEGATCILADVAEDRLESAVADIRQNGGRAEAEYLDVSDREAVREAFERIALRHGRIDIAIANAGISAGPGYLSDIGHINAIDDMDWDRVLGINLTGVLVTIQSAAEQMKRQGSGRIVAISSVAGLKSQASCGYAYVAAKAAIINIVRQAAADLSRFGISVNGLAPGPFLTSLADKKPQQGDIERLVAAIPMGRIADPSEIEGPILLLCSDASSYVTGVTIPVDGGMMAL